MIDMTYIEAFEWKPEAIEAYADSVGDPREVEFFIVEPNSLGADDGLGCLKWSDETKTWEEWWEEEE